MKTKITYLIAISIGIFTINEGINMYETSLAFSIEYGYSLLDYTNIIIGCGFSVLFILLAMMINITFYKKLW